MNILLINPLISYSLSYPIGLSYIASILKKNTNYEVFCLDLCLFDTDKQNSVIETCIHNNNINVVGIGGLSRNYTNIKNALDVVHRIDPGIISIVGGAIFSTEPELVFNLLNVDFGVVGEGEETIIQLMKALYDQQDFTNIDGIVYRKNGKPIRNPDQKPIDNIDNLPFPDYEGFDILPYLDHIDIRGTWLMDNPRVFPILASRSCPFKCTFCYHAIKKYRQRSLDSIFSEIEYAIENYHINALDIFDDLFSISRKRVIEFCKRIKKYNIYWMPQLRVNDVDKELLQIMKQSGCWSISYGFESMNQTVLNSMKKKITTSEIKNAVRLTYDAQIDIQGNFIFGDIAETLNTANETLSWWINNYTYRINLTPIETYPGAAIYLDAIKRGIIKDKKEFLENACTRINNTHMDDDTFNVMMDRIFVFQNTIVLPASIKKIKLIPDSRLIDLTVRCPHCGNHVVYKRISYSHNILSCRDCRGRFNLSCQRILGRRLIPEKLNKLLLQAQDHIQNESFDMAYQLANLVISENPNDNDAQFMVGTIDLFRGHLSKSKPLLKQCLYSDPQSARMHNNYGVNIFLDGEVEASIIHFQHALYLNPKINEALNNIKIALSFLDLASEKQSFSFFKKRSLKGYNTFDLHISEPDIQINGKGVLEKPPLRQHI